MAPIDSGYQVLLIHYSKYQDECLRCEKTSSVYLCQSDHLKYHGVLSLQNKQLLQLGKSTQLKGRCLQKYMLFGNDMIIFSVALDHYSVHLSLIHI